LQLLIFRQDTPLISPHPAHLVAEPYRASGLVLWRKADIRQVGYVREVPEADMFSCHCAGSELIKLLYYEFEELEVIVF
jgi:hypothetical protein